MNIFLQDPHVIQILNVLDILLVLSVILQFFRWMRGTKAIFFMNASIILFLIYAASRFLNLVLFMQLLNFLGLILIVSLPIIFQNELKRVIEILGKKNPIIRRLVKPFPIASESIDIVVEAATILAKKRIGALIVLQHTDTLSVVHQSGSNLDAILSRIMLEQIFYPNSPLHDGAVVIKDNRIQSAGCFLPLDNELALPQELGSRHRAGLSLSTQSDAVVVIISEEKGKISLAYHGMFEALSAEHLKIKLQGLLNSDTEVLEKTKSSVSDGKNGAM